MSATLSHVSTSSLPVQVNGVKALFRSVLASAAALRAALTTDTSDVWSLYRLARDTDSVSPAAAGKLAQRARVN